MTHQTVNLRAGCALVFGDADAQLAYERECNQARASQEVRYAIAPRQSLKTHDGRTLNAGDEVVPARDFILRIERGRPGEASLTLPVWRQLEQLVFRGVVLESDRSFPEPAPGPEAA
jgi:hypothetical protein